MNILRKAKDNYHDIETVFYPLHFFDALEIISTEEDMNDFSVTGLPVDNTGNNLCSKAYDLLKKDYPQLPFIKMHLHKAIPIGAGLGGGSADGAFMLKILKEKFLPHLETAELEKYALKLGSDCPFFLHNKPCIATRRGENIELLNLDLSAYKLLLVNPGIHIDTSWAYSKVLPSVPKKTIRQIITQSPETWKDELLNDFEIPVYQNYPAIKMIQETLYKSGAVYASLSGSGSSVYGIFNNTPDLHLSFPGSYFMRLINLK